MFEQDDPLLSTFGPGGADVVQPHDLQGHSAHGAHLDARLHQRPQQGGDDKHTQVFQWILKKADIGGGRSVSPPQGGIDDNHGGDPKHRDGYQQDSHHTEGVVGEAVLLGRAEQADGDGENTAEQQRQNAQLQRHRELSANDRGHRLILK